MLTRTLTKLAALTSAATLSACVAPVPVTRDNSPAPQITIPPVVITNATAIDGQSPSVTLPANPGVPTKRTAGSTPKAQ